MSPQANAKPIVRRQKLGAPELRVLLTVPKFATQVESITEATNVEREQVTSLDPPAKNLAELPEIDVRPWDDLAEQPSSSAKSNKQQPSTGSQSTSPPPNYVASSIEEPVTPQVDPVTGENPVSQDRTFAVMTRNALGWFSPDVKRNLGVIGTIAAAIVVCTVVARAMKNDHADDAKLALTPDDNNEFVDVQLDADTSSSSSLTSSSSGNPGLTSQQQRSFPQRSFAQQPISNQRPNTFGGVATPNGALVGQSSGPGTQNSNQIAATNFQANQVGMPAQFNSSVGQFRPQPNQQPTNSVPPNLQSTSPAQFQTNVAQPAQFPNQPAQFTNQPAQFTNQQTQFQTQPAQFTNQPAQLQQNQSNAAQVPALPSATQSGQLAGQGLAASGQPAQTNTNYAGTQQPVRQVTQPMQNQVGAATTQQNGEKFNPFEMPAFAGTNAQPPAAVAGTEEQAGTQLGANRQQNGNLSTFQTFNPQNSGKAGLLNGQGYRAAQPVSQPAPQTPNQTHTTFQRSNPTNGNFNLQGQVPTQHFNPPQGQTSPANGGSNRGQAFSQPGFTPQQNNFGRPADLGTQERPLDAGQSLPKGTQSNRNSSPTLQINAPSLGRSGRPALPVANSPNSTNAYPATGEESFNEIATRMKSRAPSEPLNTFGPIERVAARAAAATGDARSITTENLDTGVFR